MKGLPFQPKMPPKLSTTAQDKDFKPAPGLKALDLAKQADAALSNLKDAAAETLTQVDFPEGRGMNHGKVEVRDPEHVRLEYAVLPTPAERRAKNLGPMYSERLLRNGGHVVLLSMAGRKDIPTGAQISPTGDLLATWQTSFSQLILRGLADHRAPLSSYIAAAQADPKNYAVATQERSSTVSGRTYNTVRIVVTRQGAALKKLGPSRVAITLEASRKVPVTVISEFGKGSKVLWRANWHGPSKFDDADFSPPR